MFGKKKKSTLINETERYTTDAGYAGTVTHDFAMRSPYWQYRPAKYQQYKPFDEYQREIDKYLEKLFEGEIDEENGDVLDNLIGDITRQALNHLDRQRVDHGDMIHSLRARFESDRSTFEDQLRHLQEALDENRSEQSIVMKLLKKDEYAENKNRRNCDEE